MSRMKSFATKKFNDFSRRLAPVQSLTEGQAEIAGLKPIIYKRTNRIDKNVTVNKVSTTFVQIESSSNNNKYYQQNGDTHSANNQI